MAEYRTFIDRFSATKWLIRFDLVALPVRFDSVLAEPPGNKTVLPVVIVTSPQVKQVLNEKRWAAEVNKLTIEAGASVNLRKEIPSTNHEEIAKVLRFLKGRGPKLVVLDRPLGGTTMWQPRHLKLV